MNHRLLCTYKTGQNDATILHIQLKLQHKKKEKKEKHKKMNIKTQNAFGSVPHSTEALVGNPMKLVTLSFNLLGGWGNRTLNVS